MQTLEAINKRKSVRSFLDEPLSEDMIEKIVKAGKAAPSAGGLNSRKITAVEDTEMLVDATLGQNFLAQAPVAIVVLVDQTDTVANYGQRGKMYTICDAAAAVENMLIAATDLGLGSCWIGAFDEKSVQKKLETELKPVAIVPIGHEK